MAPPTRASFAPPPNRTLLATATLASQLLGTLVFALALVWIVALRITAPAVIGVLVAGAGCVFAGGNAHRGSVVALVLCAGFDVVIAAVTLLRVPEAIGFVGAPLARIAPDFDGSIIVAATGGLATLAAVASIAALPQARRFASWRGEQILHAARVRG